MVGSIYADNSSFTLFRKSLFLGRKPLFEFHHPSNTKETRTNQETHCTCLISSDSNPDPHSPTKPTQVPRLSLNELFRSSSEHQRRPKQGVVLPPLSPPKPARSQSCILLPAADKSAQLGMLLFIHKNKKKMFHSIRNCFKLNISI